MKKDIEEVKEAAKKEAAKKEENKQEVAAKKEEVKQEVAAKKEEVKQEAAAKKQENEAPKENNAVQGAEWYATRFDFIYILCFGLRHLHSSSFA